MMSRGPTNHELKIQREPFRAVVAGRKTAELRLDDRDFRIGDTMTLKEYLPRAKRFTEYEFHAKITHIVRLRHWIAGLDDDWVMLSFQAMEH